MVRIACTISDGEEESGSEEEEGESSKGFTDENADWLKPASKRKLPMDDDDDNDDEDSVQVNKPNIAQLAD